MRHYSFANVLLYTKELAFYKPYKPSYNSLSPHYYCYSSSSNLAGL